MQNQNEKTIGENTKKHRFGDGFGMVMEWFGMILGWFWDAFGIV